jgi:hypothetical protein
MKNQCVTWVIGALLRGFRARSGLLTLGTIGNVVILWGIVRFIDAQNRTVKVIQLKLDELRTRLDSDEGRVDRCHHCQGKNPRDTWSESI